MKIVGSSLLLCLVAIALVTCGGCTNAQTRTYQIKVENRSSKPVTVWLTKDGPPWEEGWKSPEDLAIESPKADEPIGGVVVPPGESRVTRDVKGKILPDVDAVLRVYLGQLTFNELLAVSRGSIDRKEVKLQPGPNIVVVTDFGSSVQAALGQE